MHKVKIYYYSSPGPGRSTGQTRPGSGENGMRNGLSILFGQEEHIQSASSQRKFRVIKCNFQTVHSPT